MVLNYFTREYTLDNVSTFGANLKINVPDPSGILKLLGQVILAGLTHKKPQFSAGLADYLRFGETQDREKRVINFGELSLRHAAHGHRRGIETENPVKLLQRLLFLTQIFANSENTVLATPAAVPYPGLHRQKIPIPLLEGKGAYISFPSEHLRKYFLCFHTIGVWMQTQDSKGLDLFRRIPELAGNCRVEKNDFSVIRGDHGQVVNGFKESQEIVSGLLKG